LVGEEWGNTSKYDIFSEIKETVDSVHLSSDQFFGETLKLLACSLNSATDDNSGIHWASTAFAMDCAQAN